MNPPPLPPTPAPEKKSFAHQAALAGLAAPVVAILLNAATTATRSGTDPHTAKVVGLVVGLAALAIILGGLVMGTIALAGIPRYGSSGLLGRGIAAIAINGVLLVFFAIGFVAAIGHNAKNRQMLREMAATQQEFQDKTRNAYNSETGITNVDLDGVHRVRDQFDNAARSMSGDDAAFARVMSAFLGRMETAGKEYQAAADTMTGARILNLGTLTDKGQINGRRDIVQKFMGANTRLESVVSHAETDLQAALVKEHVPQDKIDDAMAGFRSKASAQYSLLLKIRADDRQMGQAMLDTLDLLESNWGKWTYDTGADTVTFDDTTARTSYQQLMATIEAASKDQIATQGKLVKQMQQ